MIQETVKIIVVRSDQKKMVKTVTIVSDGSFVVVNAAVNKIVNRDFPAETVLTIGWQYV